MTHKNRTLQEDRNGEVLPRWEPHNEVRARPAPRQIPEVKHSRAPGVLCSLKIQILEQPQQRRRTECQLVHELKEVTKTHERD